MDTTLLSGSMSRGGYNSKRDGVKMKDTQIHLSTSGIAYCCYSAVRLSFEAVP